MRQFVYVSWLVADLVFEFASPSMDESATKEEEKPGCTDGQERQAGLFDLEELKLTLPVQPPLTG